MRELTKEDFFQFVNENKTVMIEFWAEWCGSCKVFGELLERIQENYPNVIFAKANIEKMMDIAEQFSIVSLPSLFCFHEGEVYSQEHGLVPECRIRSMMPENP
jgi:thioredoxin 1